MATDSSEAIGDQGGLVQRCQDWCSSEPREPSWRTVRNSSIQCLVATLVGVLFIVLCRVHGDWNVTYYETFMGPVRNAERGKCTLATSPGIADARTEVVSPRTGDPVLDAPGHGDLPALYSVNRTAAFCLVTIQYEVAGDAPIVGEVWGEVFAGYRFDGHDPTRWCHELLHSGHPWPNLRIFKPGGQAYESWLCGDQGYWGCLDDSDSIIDNDVAGRAECVFAFEGEKWDSAYLRLGEVDLDEQRRSASPLYPGFGDTPALVYNPCLPELHPATSLECLVDEGGLVQLGRRKPLLNQLRLQRQYQGSQTALLWPLWLFCWCLAGQCCYGAVRDVYRMYHKPGSQRLEEERSPLTRP